MIVGLRGRRVFELLRREGDRGRAPGIEVLRLRSDSLDATRAVGFAVSRELGSAVTRNRIRRRVRAALAEFDRADDPAFPSGSYLFRIRPGLAETTSVELRQRVKSCLTHIRARAAS